MTRPTLLWFRQDLRLSDQPAFVAAAHEGLVILVYVLDDETPKHRHMGAASRWWLHHSLAALDASLRDKGSRLILRRGACDEELARLADEVGAKRVHALRHYEPWWRNAERAVGKKLDLTCHDGNELAPPGSVTTGGGHPYKIFTPFWRALRERMPPPHPVRRPARIGAPDHWPKSDDLADWHLLPTKPDWATGFVKEWTPGEEGAHARLEDFHDEASRYQATRDLPDVEGTSRLSPHLHFGEISPAQVWHRVSARGGSVGTFLGEVAWRDYARNVILQFPDYGSRNGRDALDGLRWRTGKASEEDLRAWQRGRTGYPIVDAGMRQLWATGWMHNRVRMIVASFLVKHLRIHWREGEAWFWDTLVDADLANNTGNWQWVAGSGADASPYFRIFNPMVQGAKFDPGGEYVRRWCPELKMLLVFFFFAPFDADSDVLEDVGVKLGRDYPKPIVDHRQAREDALAAYRKITR